MDAAICKILYRGPLPTFIRSRVRVLEKLLMPERIYRTIIIEPSKYRVRLRLGDAIQAQMYYYGFSEPQLVHFFCSHIRPNSIVIDVGAHCGQYALIASRAQPDVVVYSFEPDSENVRDLHYNLRLNEINNIHVRQIAVSDQCGVLSLYTDTESFGFSNHSLARGKQVFHGAEEQVEVVTLDSIFGVASQRISVIKLDIEGAELLALRGAEAILRRDHPALLLEVDARWTANFHYAPADVYRYLSALGYSCYWIDEREQLHYIQDASVMHEWNWAALVEPSRGAASMSEERLV